MRTELVSIPTDTVPLDGAYYRPESGAAAGAVLLMHGNTMNFYTGAPRFLPPVLVELGLACLAYNRRGHDVLSTRDSRDLQGGAFQSTEQAVADNRIAAEWLADQGFAAPIVVGHSNGGTLAVRHVADHAETPALVLLSAHAGGKDIARRMSENGLWGRDRLDEIAARARDMVANSVRLAVGVIIPRFLPALKPDRSDYPPGARVLHIHRRLLRHLATEIALDDS